MTMLIRLGVLLAIAATQPLFAAPSVSWQIDETIDRGDTSLFWASPTAIDLGLTEYLYDYEITEVTASVRFFTTIEVDVTDLIGESFDLLGGGAAPSLPAVLVDDAINDPSTGTRADVRIEIDSAGFGQASFQNVMLGRADTPFGRLDIESVRIQATVDVVGVAPLEPADFNGDGAVDRNDYALWAASYGATTGVADGNNDGVADPADYTVWRDRFDSPLDGFAVPEPASGATLAVAGGLLVVTRRNGRRR